MKERLGVELVQIAEGRYDEVMASVDAAAAETEAKRWLDEAERMVEPTREDVVKAAQGEPDLGSAHRRKPCSGTMRRDVHGLAAARFSLPGFFAPERPGDPRRLRRGHGLLADDADLPARASTRPVSWAMRRAWTRPRTPSTSPTARPR